MTRVLILMLMWILLATPLAVLVGLAIHRADAPLREPTSSPPVTPLELGPARSQASDPATPVVPAAVTVPADPQGAART